MRVCIDLTGLQTSKVPCTAHSCDEARTSMGCVSVTSCTTVIDNVPAHVGALWLRLAIKIGPARTRTWVRGFRVLGANHYTTGPCWLPYMCLKWWTNIHLGTVGVQLCLNKPMVWHDLEDAWMFLSISVTQWTIDAGIGSDRLDTAGTGWDPPVGNAPFQNDQNFT